jgi:hypothetical protein
VCACACGQQGWCAGHEGTAPVRGWVCCVWICACSLGARWHPAGSAGQTAAGPAVADNLPPASLLPFLSCFCCCCVLATITHTGASLAGHPHQACLDPLAWAHLHLASGRRACQVRCCAMGLWVLLLFWFISSQGGSLLLLLLLHHPHVSCSKVHGHSTTPTHCSRSRRAFCCRFPPFFVHVRRRLAAARRAAVPHWWRAPRRTPWAWGPAAVPCRAGSGASGSSAAASSSSSSSRRGRAAAAAGQCAAGVGGRGVQYGGAPGHAS